MAKTKFEEMMDRLPSHIKDSDLLRDESKKVLAALLELLLHSQARETRVIFVNNGTLRRFSGINANSLLEAIKQLEDYGLITRKVGTVRAHADEKGTASEYTIHFENLKKPLKEPSFEDLFGDFFEEVESSETPINTTITTTIPNTITNTTAIASSIAIATSNTNSNTTTRSIPRVEDNNKKYNSIDETPTLDGGVSTDANDLVKTVEIPTEESPTQEKLFRSLRERYRHQIEEECKDMDYLGLTPYMNKMLSHVTKHSFELGDEYIHRLEIAIKLKIDELKEKAVQKMVQEAESADEEDEFSFLN